MAGLPDDSGASEFLVSAEDAGQRLDRFLAAQLPELSRNRIQSLMDDGHVLVNGLAKKPSHRVALGETITIGLPPPASGNVEPEAIPLDILYEDSDLAVINKPAGMTVHPGAGAETGTLVAALLHHFRQARSASDDATATQPNTASGLSSVGGPLRPGIVHRLDKDTSGAIVVARTDAAHAKLAAAFSNRLIEKTYIALLHGKPRGESGRIELPIARDLHRRSRMTTRRREGREARTDWRALAHIGNFTLVEADLHTGRTHQIRVHFSALGCPVVGDTVYGAPREERVGKELLPPLGRNFLHAARIAFAHPRTGERLEFRAPLPAEIVDYLHALAGATGTPSAPIDAALHAYL
ncbi:MAG TPA: RluA family pseudouridine synthase [Candidatus Acidoferrales bacterium]|nr:RluA family pseudouridine synthase [Candidatus Acidoferrales bacterium]